MKALLWCLPAILWSTLLLVGCRESSHPPQRTSAPDIARDIDIENRIKESLDRDHHVKRSDVSIEVKSKRVKLSGTVASEAERSRAVQIAQTIGAGLQVEDRIQVKPSEVLPIDARHERAKQERSASGSPATGRVHDVLIHSKIVAKLAAQRHGALDVDVVDGTVILRGKVKSPAERERAEQLARDTEGVTGVKNQIEINS